MTDRETTPLYDQWLWRVYNLGFPDGHENGPNTWGDWQIISAEDALRLAADDAGRRYEFVPYTPCRPSNTDIDAHNKKGLQVTDRELLEAAAIAMDYIYVQENKKFPVDGMMLINGDVWNPLKNLGDRYELIKTLRLNIDFPDQCVWKRLPDRTLIQEFWHEEGDDADPDLGDEAHAVLRAAFEVGRRK